MPLAESTKGTDVFDQVRDLEKSVSNSQQSIQELSEATSVVRLASLLAQISENSPDISLSVHDTFDGAASRFIDVFRERSAQSRQKIRALLPLYIERVCVIAERGLDPLSDDRNAFILWAYFRKVRVYLREVGIEITIEQSSVDANLDEDQRVAERNVATIREALEKLPVLSEK